jgi:hypothetical protein
VRTRASTWCRILGVFGAVWFVVDRIIDRILRLILIVLGIALRLLSAVIVVPRLAHCRTEDSVSAVDVSCQILVVETNEGVRACLGFYVFSIDEHFVTNGELSESFSIRAISGIKGAINGDLRTKLYYLCYRFLDYSLTSLNRWR